MNDARSELTLRSASGWPRDVRATDASRDLLPVVMAGLAAWWVTVRPAAVAADAWVVRALAVLSLLGIGLMTTALLRRWPHFHLIAISGFVVPSALTWLMGDAAATSLLDPIEVFVGGVAWAVLAILFMRPQAVAIPQGSEGGQGPTLGAGDDLARTALHEMDAALQEPPPKLTPRQPIPPFSTVPLYLSLALCGVVAWRILRVGTAHPDRAVLARVVGAAIMIALLTSAGELAEARYIPRVVPKAGQRLMRSAFALSVVLLLLFVYAVAFGRLT